MADERFAFVVAVVGSADVMSPYALERLLALLVNRHQDTRKICLVSCARGPALQWCQNRGWSLILGSDDRNRVKRDCSLVATADALVVLGDPAPWERLLRLCREARIPTRVFPKCPKLPPGRERSAEG
jgi:hypothetical protein